MQTLTINVQDDTVLDKIVWFLKNLHDKGVEITSKEDLEDLKLLKATRDEETLSFEEYLKNEN